MKKILSAVLSLMMIVSCASFVSAKEVVIEGTNEVAVAIDDVVVTDATAKIYVPTASLSAYQAAPNWENYATHIEGYEFEQ